MNGVLSNDVYSLIIEFLINDCMVTNPSWFELDRGEVLFDGKRIFEIVKVCKAFMKIVRSKEKWRDAVRTYLWTTNSRNYHTTKKKIKILIVGDGGVGKSTFIIRRTHHVFSDCSDPTIEDSYPVLVSKNPGKVFVRFDFE